MTAVQCYECWQGDPKQPCPWWCEVCLLHHPVRDMVRSCRERAERAEY